mmetsp:Transcript_86951/g.140979  ORF Transcript_86951/g.140979 Transcript_86951/m.140979 type:complete len:221 (-) Transcript_86951:2041-2703(-)
MMNQCWLQCWDLRKQTLQAQAQELLVLPRQMSGLQRCLRRKRMTTQLVLGQLQKSVHQSPHPLRMQMLRQPPCWIRMQILLLRGLYPLRRAWLQRMSSLPHLLLRALHQIPPQWTQKKSRHRRWRYYPQRRPSQSQPHHQSKWWQEWWNRKRASLWWTRWLLCCLSLPWSLQRQAHQRCCFLRTRRPPQQELLWKHLQHQRRLRRQRRTKLALVLPLQKR